MPAPEHLRSAAIEPERVKGLPGHWTPSPHGRLRLGLAGAALLAYLPGIGWGLPSATSATMVRGWALDSIAGIGVLSELYNLLVQPMPDWYTAYPLLHYGLLSTVYAPYLGWLLLTGGLTAPSGVYPFGFADPVSALVVLEVLARTVTLAMAIATVLLVFEIGRRLADDRAGVVAALCYLLAGPVVYYARTSNLDVPAQFWTAAGMFVALRALDGGLTERRGLWLGVLVACAVGTKDQAYGAWIGGLAFLAGWHLKSAAPTQRWRPLALMAVSGVVVFLLANGWPIRPERLVRHLRFLAGFESSFFNVQHPSFLTVLRDPTVPGYLRLGGDAVHATLEAVGTPTAVLGVVGLTMARGSAGTRLMLWMLAGLALLVLGPIRHMQYRYAMLPALVLCLGAGVTVARLAAAGGPPRRTLAVIAAAIAVAWSGTKAFDLTWQMVRDSRYAAGDWLAQGARPGDQVAFFGARHQLPQLKAGVTPVPLSDTAWAAPLADGGIRFVLVAPDYFSDPTRVRSTFLPESTYRALLDGRLGYRLVRTFRTAPVLPRVLPYFPYVNPTVRLFERAP